MSDGSATIRFRDPQTFGVTREIEVKDNGMPLAMLNELEYIDGEIWANIWYDDRIARISPADGKVLGFIDLSTLYPKSARGSEAVLNGIAYDAAAKRLFVTGKNWPQLYEIEVSRP
jgi:glutaminyl-peptide cyclotransferase